jgi:hypothetical protein
MEYMSFFATEGTVDLAQEKGKCLESDNTWPGRGVFTHERRAEGVNELTDFTPNPDIPWEPLRVRMKTYGVRNATNIALPPVESSSVVINSTNGISMVKDGRDGKPKSDRMMRALALRVGISVLLFLCLLGSYLMGWIKPTGIPFN